MYASYSIIESVEEALENALRSVILQLQAHIKHEQEKVSNEESALNRIVKEHQLHELRKKVESIRTYFQTRGHGVFYLNFTYGLQKSVSSDR